MEQWTNDGPAPTWSELLCVSGFQEAGNVALHLCYPELLKHRLWNHLGSSCRLLHESLSVWSYLIQDFWNTKNTRARRARGWMCGFVQSLLEISLSVFLKGLQGIKRPMAGRAMAQREAMNALWLNIMMQNEARKVRQILCEKNWKGSAYTLMVHRFCLDSFLTMGNVSNISCVTFFSLSNETISLWVTIA